MKNNFQKIFLKDGSKVNYYFLSMMMQRKKDLVRAVHNSIIEKNLRDTYWKKTELENSVMKS